MEDGASVGYENEYFYGSVGVTGVEWPAQVGGWFARFSVCSGRRRGGGGGTWL